jgi:hypothetical protein
VWEPKNNRVGLVVFNAEGVGRKVLRAVHLRSFSFFLAFFDPKGKISCCSNPVVGSQEVHQCIRFPYAADPSPQKAANDYLARHSCRCGVFEKRQEEGNGDQQGEGAV